MISKRQIKNLPADRSIEEMHFDFSHGAASPHLQVADRASPPLESLSRIAGGLGDFA